MVALFDDETVQELRRIFDGLRRNLVDLLIVDSVSNPGSSGNCGTCPEALQLAREIESISNGKVSFHVLDSSEARSIRPRYLPAFVYDTRKRNIRYYGLPSGQEFAPFIYVHEHLSEGVKLPKNIQEEIEVVETPMHIKVFVTPECPYCPIVVDFFNQAGIINENLLVEAIEAFEHPYEADRYNVQYVPYVAINRIEDYNVYGAKPIVTIPGYAPIEELIEALKLAEKKIRKTER
ncbi:MAG: thioredoxin family protein [Desulfurococcaceae archaeon]